MERVATVVMSGNVRHLGSPPNVKLTKRSVRNNLPAFEATRVNWYYAQNSERIGPIDQAEFDRLVQSGVINPSTLVWREGMPNWLAHGELSAPPQMNVGPAPAGGGIRCVECGGFFPQDQVIRLGPGYVCAACKPIVVQKMGEGVMTSGADQIRNEHIKHEASVKSVGLLYFLGGTGFALLGLVSCMGGTFASIMIGLALAGVGAGQIVVGVGLRRLRSWARIPTGILSGLGLLGFPMGTLINGYILYLIFCQKGATVFSDDYKQVIAETPHIKYRTSIIVWIFLGLLFFLIVFALIAFGLRPRR